jgi:hypothetical protein
MFIIASNYLFPNDRSIDTEFFVFQLRIRVKCCFGILVQRWSILHAPMPCGFSIKKIIAISNALAKLHNFCINKRDGTPDSILAVDAEHLMHNEGGSLELVSRDTHDVPVPEGVMDYGNHFQHVPRAHRRMMTNNNSEDNLPRKEIHDKVASSHYCCPNRVTK